MNMRELTIDELDQVSGGTSVPGGTVEKGHYGTLMTFDGTNAWIFVGNDGHITTGGTGGDPTTTKVPK